jgi:hypothetical protein
MGDVKLVQEPLCLFLDHDAGKHHASPPHPAAHGKFLLYQADPKALFPDEGGGSEA